MNRNLRAALIAALAVLLVAAAYAAICAGVALTLTRAKRLPFTRLPGDYGLAYEGVSFPSQVDRIRLEGWLLRGASVAGARPPRPVIVVHGSGADRQVEAGGRVLEIAAHLVRRGHTVLLFDLRGSGRSGGERFTLGAQEVRDLGGAIDFLQRRGLAENGVDLLGFSMGAATALLEASADERVRAVAADSGYADLASVLDEQLPRASHLPRPFTPGTILLARLLLDLNVAAIRPVDATPALAARGVPVLIIHGEADRLVPVGHAHRLAQGYGPGVETLLVPDADHVESYAARPTAYLARLDALFGRAT